MVIWSLCGRGGGIDVANEVREWTEFIRFGEQCSGVAGVFGGLEVAMGGLGWLRGFMVGTGC